MAENKTKPIDALPEAYLSAISDKARRADCNALSQLMAKASKHAPKMWGTSIVGFGTYTYPLSGGRSGQICAVGFSSRKGDISIYGVAGENADPALLAKLGRYKRGKGCLYIARLSDVDVEVLEKLIANAIDAKTPKR